LDGRDGPSQPSGLPDRQAPFRNPLRVSVFAALLRSAFPDTDVIDPGIFDPDFFFDAAVDAARRSVEVPGVPETDNQAGSTSGGTTECRKEETPEGDVPLCPS